jgi:hypothetical protein
MSSLYEIVGQNESATVSAAFDDVKRALLQDSQWAAHVLDVAGKGGLRVAYAKVYGTVLGSQVVAEGPGYFLIRGTAGKNTRLMYRIQALDERTTRITPEGRASTFAKIVIPLGLLIWCVVPVVLTPLLYWAVASGMRRFSRRCLDAFCRYLEARLSAPASPGTV